MICIYHSIDFDGQCSAAIVKQRYPMCSLYPLNHGDPFDISKLAGHDIVFMVDYSLPESDMIAINNIKDTSFIWIDHHKTAINWYSEYIKNGGVSITGTRDVKTAACNLVWNFIYPNLKMPKFVYLFGQYDIWNFTSDEVLPFQYGCKQYDNMLDDLSVFWNNLFSDYDESFTNTLIINGRIILPYVNWEFIKLMETSFDITFEGKKCLCCNCQHPSSKHFRSKWDNTKYDCMLAFRWDKNKYFVSMYTDKYGIDVSSICKKYGGGGHSQAAGFTCYELPFILPKE